MSGQVHGTGVGREQQVELSDMVHKFLPTGSAGQIPDLSVHDRPKKGSQIPGHA